MQALQPRSRNLERFGLVRVRSPLLTESRLISFPTGTEMFQFPALAPFRVLHVAVGCPIRRSSVRRVLARSPRLIAGSCVLHRLLLPRHPSCALCSLNHHCVRSMTRSPLAWLRGSTRRLPYPYMRFQRALDQLASSIARADAPSVAEEQVESMVPTIVT